MVYQKQPENMEYYNYLGSMITNDGRRTQVKLKSGLPW
jgi:hypothetical protein